MDNAKKTKKRFNLLDVAIILVVIAVLAFAAYKLMPRGSTVSYEAVTISFHYDDVADYVTEYLKVGDPVIDADRSVYMGKITDIEIYEAEIWSPNAEGIMVKSAAGNRRSAIITVRVSGEPSAYGIRLSSVEYSVGHTMAIRAGFAKMPCVVMDIVYDNPEVPQNIAKSITG